jgi:hypothetical protein
LAKSRSTLGDEARLLSRLQSIYAWRGQLVDYLLSYRLTPSLNSGRAVTLAQLLTEARTIFDEQVELGLNHAVREQPPSSPRTTYPVAAWREVEYGEPITKETIDCLWHDIDLSIRNLFQMGDLRKVLREATYRISQRPLQFHLDDINVKAIPDLIAFFRDHHAAIIDWKVNAGANRDHRLQLALYGLTFTRCHPHADFAKYLDGPTQPLPSLTEVQLLSGEIRSYELDQTDFDRAEAYIAESATEMSLALGNQRDGEPRPEDFEVTRFPGACERCQFRKICWEGPRDGMA